MSDFFGYFSDYELKILVGIRVGGMLGPLAGWFIGTFATFFAVVAMNTSNVRGMRSSGFMGD